MLFSDVYCIRYIYIGNKYTMLTAFFSTIHSNDQNHLKELLEENTALIIGTMLKDYVLIAYNWLTKLLQEDVENSVYVQDATNTYLTTTPINWTIQCKSFDAFKSF